MKVQCYRCKGSGKIVGGGYMQKDCPICKGERFAEPQEMPNVILPSTSNQIAVSRIDLTDDEILAKAKEITKKRRLESMAKAKAEKKAAKLAKIEKEKNDTTS